MKYLKIILIFIVFVGAIVLVMNWKSSGSTGSREKGESETDKINVEVKCTDFREQWANTKSWDQKLYDRQSGQVEAWKEQKLLSERGYNTLSTVVREQAVRKINDSYIALLTPSAYSHNQLLNAYKGVDYLKSHEQSIDNDFQEIDEIHSLYLKIRSFVSSPHAISPTFNPKTGTWSSFTAERNNILSTASSYRNNRHYAELKNVPGFQEGLNTDQLQKQLDSMKPEYYRRLSRLIANEISELTPNKENYERMKRVYERFAKEDSANASVVYSALNKMEKSIPVE